MQKTFEDRNDSRFDNKFKSEIEHEFKTLEQDLNNYTPSKEVSFTFKELETELKKLKINKAPEPDHIQNILIKQANNKFKQLILDLFNTTLLIGKV